jgi:hypothetical protein
MMHPLLLRCQTFFLYTIPPLIITLLLTQYPILTHNTVNMKEAIVQADGSVQIVDSPIPTPGEHQVVIKVAVSGTNPKDWKVPQW